MGKGLNFAESGIFNGRLYLQDGGNVGIGTTEPSELFSVNNTFTVDAEGNVTATSIDFDFVEPFEISTNGGNNQTTRLSVKNITTPDIGAGATADIDFYLWEDNDCVTPQARIGIIGPTVQGEGNDAGGRLVFYTTPNEEGGDLAERMRITPEGYVGIGTTEPSELFSVNNKFMVDENGDVTAHTINAENYEGLESSPWQRSGDHVYYNVEGGNVKIGSMTTSYSNYKHKLQVFQEGNIEESLWKSHPFAIVGNSNVMVMGTDENAENNGTAYIQNWHFNTNDKNGATANLSLNPKGGNVEIGNNFVVTPAGHVFARRVKVTQGNIPDYVFEPDYNLLPLPELETFITQNKHLPEVPSEAEVIENGLDLGEFNATLLLKIEELTLYIIDLNKRMEQLEKENNNLKKEK